MTVRELAAAAADRLKRARIPEPRREAESLLAHALGKDGAWIVARGDDAVPPAKAKVYAAMIARRSAREPFAYVVGEKWFYGRRFRVSKDVLIPRPETELLVEAILSYVIPSPRTPARALGTPLEKRFLPARSNARLGMTGMTIVDVGTGSGAVGATLAAELPEAKAVLYDVSKKALEAARANVLTMKLGRRVRLAKLDVLRQALPEPKSGFTILAANLPYLPIATWKKASPEVRLREPKLALVSGKDGLAHYRALFKKLACWKRPPGLLALEAEPGQFVELRRLTLDLLPDADIEILKDLHGDDRVLVAVK